jgi:hypothetical protein
MNVLTVQQSKMLHNFEEYKVDVWFNHQAIFLFLFNSADWHCLAIGEPAGLFRNF